MSKFSEWLTAILDQTGLFSRKEWAEFLTISEQEIESWVQGNTLPNPVKLRSIVSVLLESDGVEGVREGLAMIERLQLSEISTFPRDAWNDAYTLAEYLCLPLVDGLRRSMAGLTMPQREEVLLGAAEAARKIKE